MTRDLPTPKQFRTAGFNIVPPARPGDEPRVSVEGATARPPYHYVVSLAEFSALNADAMDQEGADEDAAFLARVWEIDVDLDECWGVTL